MTLTHDTPIQYLKGVGPKLGEVLARRGISTVKDLLEWYPRAYEDRRAARSIASLKAGDRVSLVATVLAIRSAPLGRSQRKIYEVLVGDGSGRISCKYFRVPYKGYFQRFQVYQKVRVTGKVTDYRGRLEFHHPDIHLYNPEEEENSDALIPLYTETEGLSPTKLRKIIETAIDSPVLAGTPDVLPKWVCEKYQLMSRAEAIKWLHQPPVESSEEMMASRSPAHKRIIFEEFFWLELHLALRRSGLKKEQGQPLNVPSPRLTQLKSSLPFALTKAQEKVLNEILTDLAKPHPMHRLVQGDVGCGKTMVAFMAAVHAADNKTQTSLMVPTEILAEQHYLNAKKFLSPIGVHVELLTGGMKASEKKRILEQVKLGQVDLLIGTHALIQDEVEFKNLALVVIDEQHRFGVDQRTRLKDKGVAPHFLVMTATPIPRTLAMTVYGDLDVSVIDELPPGRTEVVTRKVFGNKRDKVFSFMKEQIKKGRQAYIVYPLIEESEKIDLKDALTEFESLKQQFPEFKIGLLHGRMKPEEKDEIMRQFRDHELDILVSTTVIEVGVDVPNANMMIIEHAERFGLSQLHQLRGRVGRGQHRSYCVLILGYALSEESRARAEVMERTTNGFEIAEADLEMRGPGEFMGTRQSGLPGFRMANLVRDSQILQMARQAAFAIVEKDPTLSSPENMSLRKQLDLATKNVVA